MSVLPKGREATRKAGAWVAARPYALFILAAGALGIASIVITLPPEVR
jgi:hypothetical protein